MNAADNAKTQLRDRPEFKSMPKPLTFTGDVTVVEAVRAMCQKNFGSVIVVDADGKIEGIVTERDLMRKVIDKGKDPNTTRLQDIMTGDIRVARETDNVVDWLRIMSNERFRRLPVVDENGKLLNVFTQGDFVSYTWPDLLYQVKEGTRKSVNRNFPLWVMVGGIMLYSILMIILVSAI